MSQKGRQQERAPKPSKRFLLVWLLPLLLPIVLYLPLIAGEIQHKLIGNEYPCCALFTVPEYIAKAEHAKSLHWLSDLIIGGSILLSLALVIIVMVVTYRFGIPGRLSDHARVVAKFALFIFTVPLLLLLLATMIYFCANNDNYYRAMSQPPGGSTVYDYILREW